MSTCGVSYLDLLHELCLQRGLAVLLTATPTPAGFAERGATVLVNLDVVAPALGPATHAELRSRKQQLRAGELVVRCQLDTVDGDLDAAAELLVQVLTRRQAKAA